MSSLSLASFPSETQLLRCLPLSPEGPALEPVATVSAVPARQPIDYRRLRPIRAEYQRIDDRSRELESKLDDTLERVDDLETLDAEPDRSTLTAPVAGGTLVLAGEVAIGAAAVVCGLLLLAVAVSR